MKRITVFVCLLLLVHSLSFASDWATIGTANNGNQYFIDLDEMYFDRSSGSVNRNMVVAHEKTVLSPSEITRYQEITRKRGQYHSGWDYLTHIITYYQYDISGKNHAIKYLAFMNQNDNIIAEYRQSPLRFKPVPSGLDEKEYNLILQNIDKVKE